MTDLKISVDQVNRLLAILQELPAKFVLEAIVILRNLQPVAPVEKPSEE
jgi:hypothetical protein